MRTGRIAIVLAAMTLTGAYLGLWAQERRDPWPPRPIVPPDSEEQEEPSKAGGLPPPGTLDVDLSGEKRVGGLEAAAVGGLPPPAPPPGLADLPPPAPPPVKGLDLPTPKLADPPPPAPRDPLLELPPLPKLEEKKGPTVPEPRTAPAVTETVEPPAKPAPAPRPSETVPLPAAAPPIAAPPIAAPPAGAAGIGSSPGSDRPPSFRLVQPITKNRPGDSMPGPLREGPPVHASPIAVSGSTLTVEKRGPAVIKHGEPAAYILFVRNPSGVPVLHVRVEDEVPAGAKVLAADPEPVLSGGRASWLITALGAGEEKQIRFTLQPANVGEMATSARVFVPVATSMARTLVQPGAVPAAAESGLLLAARAPATAALDAVVPFELHLHNAGRLPLNKLFLQVKMSDGLYHPEGREIDAELKGLAAGGKETIKLPLKAVKTGMQTLDVVVQALDGQRTTARASVMVGEAGLKVEQSSGARLMARKVADLTVDVTNYQAHGLRNVVVVHQLPEEVDFVSASERGLFREDARTVHWLVEHLGPGEKKQLRLQVMARKGGAFTTEAVARAEAAGEARATGLLKVDEAVTLNLEVAGRDQALEIGKETLYEIKVHNEGTGPATGIQVAAKIPEGMAAHLAKGPTPFRVEGRNLVFQPVRALSPGEKTSYYVGLTAQAPGTQSLRVELASDQLRAPIEREDRLLVYRDK